jgi:hypothetical protein
MITICRERSAGLFFKIPASLYLLLFKYEPGGKKSVEFGKGTVDIIGLMKQTKQASMKYFIEQEEYL